MAKQNVPGGPGSGDGAAPKAAPRRAGFTLKPSRQTCYILGGLMGLTLLGSAGLFVWRKGEIDRVDAVLEQKKTEVASGEQIARRLTQVEADYAGMQSQLRYLETSVTAGEYVPTLLKQMERLAKEVKLTVNGVRPTLEPAPPPPTDKEQRKTYKPWPYDKLHVEMDVKGSYWNVARVLYRLTEFPKIMSVESVSITPQSATTGYNPDLNVKMKLTGFIFKNEERTPPVGEGAAPGGGAAPAGGATAASAASVQNERARGMSRVGNGA